MIQADSHADAQAAEVSNPEPTAASLAAEESGATTVEYALLVSLIALAIFSSLLNVGEGMKTTFNAAGTSVAGTQYDAG